MLVASIASLASLIVTAFAALSRSIDLHLFRSEQKQMQQVAHVQLEQQQPHALEQQKKGNTFNTYHLNKRNKEGLEVAMEMNEDEHPVDREPHFRVNPLQVATDSSAGGSSVIVNNQSSSSAMSASMIELQSSHAPSLQ